MVLVDVQIRRVEGLEDLLRSLSLDEESGKTHHVVYPWHEYSQIPGQDIGFWYSAERCQYSTLRRLILQRFNGIGHPSSDRLADGLVLAFVLMPRAGDVLTEFERMLSSFAAADVSQFLLIPASALLRFVTVGQSPKHDLIGFFGHRPFRYAPFAGDLMEKVKHRFERIGMVGLLPELDKFFGRIAVCREPQSTKVVDFAGLGFMGHQPPGVLNLIQYYFDDLSEVLFEDFWEKHLESQYVSVAAGAALLDRASLEALPGTGWLSIFWGFDLLAGKGMISLITEESHRRDTLAVQVYSLGTGLAEAKRRMDLEITEHLGPGPHAVYPSLLKFAGLVAHSRGLQNRGYVSESFTLLMVAMESLLAERDSISATLSRRAGALLAVSGDKSFEDSVASILKLYGIRSKFVHQGESVAPDSLKALQEVCRTVFFSAYRSQARFAETGGAANDWKGRWLATLDYVAACFDVGAPVDSDAAATSGALRNQPGRASG